MCFRISPQNEAAKKGLERLEKLMKVCISVTIPAVTCYCALHFNMVFYTCMLLVWKMSSVGGGSGCTWRRWRKWRWWCWWRCRWGWPFVRWYRLCHLVSPLLVVHWSKQWWDSMLSRWASAEVHRHANVTRFATAIAGTGF